MKVRLQNMLYYKQIELHKIEPSIEHVLTQGQQKGKNTGRLPQNEVAFNKCVLIYNYRTCSHPRAADCKKTSTLGAFHRMRLRSTNVFSYTTMNSRTCSHPRAADCKKASTLGAFHRMRLRSTNMFCRCVTVSDPCVTSRV